MNKIETRGEFENGAPWLVVDATVAKVSFTGVQAWASNTTREHAQVLGDAIRDAMLTEDFKRLVVNAMTDEGRALLDIAPVAGMLEFIEPPAKVELPRWTDAELSNVFCTALEGGGSAYWMNEGYKVSIEYVGEPLDDCYYRSLSINRDSHGANCGQAEEVRMQIDYDALWQAIGKLLTGEVPIRADIRSQILEEKDGCDAEAADVIMQVAVFNEVIYG